ncbi:MAG: dimethylarginine dimethylaminohydrolase family protein [Gammaproteobacteria bacterium]
MTRTGRQTVLMCPPDHFSVDYVINPWMAGNEGMLDRDRARAQWQALRDELGAVADIELLEPQPELPDLVFTANAGFVAGDRAVPSHFMPQERRPEEAYLKQWFAARGFDLRVLPDDVGFEGAGDCLIDRAGPWLWTGYGFRTEIVAHAFLADWFDREVVSIRLVDSRFYHIDTCLCPLAGGYLLYFPDAFDADSIAAIEARVPAPKRLCVSAEDAGNFACNAVNIDRHIFGHRFSAALKARLGEAGFEVREVALSEFLKAGGSAKCLTLRLTEPGATA